jgi:TPR repeat protein
MYELGDGAARDVPAALELYRQAAKLGNARALYRLAWHNYKGEFLPRDPAQAARLLRQAIDRGDGRDAVSLLGLLHDLGEGVPKDVPQALSLYRKAAAAGSPQAHQRLAYHVYFGESLPRDPQEAARLLHRAIELGDRIEAKALLALLHERGEGVPQDLAQALKLYREAAEAGSHRAMFELGRLHEQGLGTRRNVAAAVGWYEKALPDPDAKAALERLRRPQP